MLKRGMQQDRTSGLMSFFCLGPRPRFGSEIIVRVFALGGTETQADGVMDEDPLRRLYDLRRVIYSERDRRLAEAWKAPPKQESGLAILIRDPSAPIEHVADVLRAECAKRGRGKPGGAHWRWTKPHYLIAHFIEQSGAERTDGCISDWIDKVNGWAMMRNRKRLDPQPSSRDHTRVRELLRGSKRRRL
jgi:hypothetical protein